MSTKIGHFEILSELARCATSTVYKANDEQTSQTVALKAIQLSAFGDEAGNLEKCLLAEAEKTKALSHSNLAPVFGAGEIDGQFCAAMEYIQGNSIATMVSRKEGFSIWDLLDIGRQVCGGLDHAQSHGVFHYSLEPAKIMCGWDGTTKILGYGLSSVGRFTAQMPEIPSILYYMSPEQVRGEEIDARSNIFSLGSIFYEMVTDSKPFNGADADTLRQSILDGALPAPALVKPKVHPGLSALIMKALSKDPAQRYQSCRELLDDLENCKESKGQAAKPAPAKGTVVPDAVKAANQGKFVGASAKPEATPAFAAAQAASSPVSKKSTVTANTMAAKAASAAASAKSASSPFAGAAKANEGARPAASMSASVMEEEAAEAPKINVDPMMAGESGKAAGVSFSEMTELPPLKESYAPSIPEPSSQRLAPEPLEAAEFEPEKPKVQPREVAEKAIKEIKNVPPRLMIYSIAGAAVVILIIAVILVMHVNTLNNDGDAPRPAPVEAKQPEPQPAPTPVPVQSQASPAPEQPAPVPEQAQTQPEVQETEPAEPARNTGRGFASSARGKNSRKKGAAAPAAVVIPGQMAIDSTPQGAQVQIDGRTDASWVTPVTLSGLAPGQHSITVSKAGFASDSRTIDITSGSKSFVQTHLSQLVATLSVTSTPSGANVYVDGKDIGKLTPAQVPVEKGQHIVLVRKSGYIDETTNAQFVLGQTVSFSPSLRALGNVDDIKTVGKMKKLFGNKEAQGMGVVSVKTTPKGAQIAVNQHMLEKDSPVDFLLDPGNYVIDITMTGYVPIHKVVTVDKGGKAVIDEVLQRE